MLQYHISSLSEKHNTFIRLKTHMWSESYSFISTITDINVEFVVILKNTFNIT